MFSSAYIPVSTASLMPHAVPIPDESRHGAYVARQAVPLHSVTDDDEYAIAVAFSSSTLAIPPSSGYTAIIGLRVGSIHWSW